MNQIGMLLLETYVGSLGTLTSSGVGVFVVEVELITILEVVVGISSVEERIAGGLRMPASNFIHPPPGLTKIIISKQMQL